VAEALSVNWKVVTFVKWVLRLLSHRSSKAEEEASFRADAERGKVAIKWVRQANAAVRSSREEEAASLRADAEQALEEASRHRADAAQGKVAITWIRQTRLRLSAAFRAGKWAYRAKDRVVPTGSAALRPQRGESKLESAAEKVQREKVQRLHQGRRAPVASASRPESSASKYAVAPGEKEGEIIVKDLT